MKLRKVDVIVITTAQQSQVHLTSPEALDWVERKVGMHRRVGVTSLSWPKDLADEFTQAMEKDGLGVERGPESRDLVVKILPVEGGNPAGKLADVELEFNDGPLEGLTLGGFAIWERKNGGRTVTFPSSEHSVNGERRSFALVRPQTGTAGQERVRDLILQAYSDHAAAAEGGL